MPDYEAILPSNAAEKTEARKSKAERTLEENDSARKEFKAAIIPVVYPLPLLPYYYPHHQDFATTKPQTNIQTQSTYENNPENDLARSRLIEEVASKLCRKLFLLSLVAK